MGTQSAVALQALVNLSCGNEAGQAGIIAAGALARLARLLRRTSPDKSNHKRKQSWSSPTSPLMMVVKAGVVPLLVDCLLTAGTIEIKRRAALALRAIANAHDTRAAVLAAAPFLPLMVHLLASGSEEAQEHAQQTLHYLSNAPSFPLQIPSLAPSPPWCSCCGLTRPSCNSGR